MELPGDHRRPEGGPGAGARPAPGLPDPAVRHRAGPRHRGGGPQQPPAPGRLHGRLRLQRIGDQLFPQPADGRGPYEPVGLRRADGDDPFTFAVGRGTFRAAKLTRVQAEENLRSIAADIAVAVAAADGQIETTRKRVAADEAAVALAKQALEAEEKKNKAGTGSTFSVVQEQQILVEAENSVSSALAAERQAVAVYDQTLGTTLERYHVKLTYD